MKLHNNDNVIIHVLFIATSIRTIHAEVIYCLIEMFAVRF